jgi:hypothetical protein
MMKPSEEILEEGVSQQVLLNALLNLYHHLLLCCLLVSSAGKRCFCACQFVLCFVELWSFGA